MKKLVQFGAGNIGRSFIGQLFSKAGYEVVFVDVDQSLIKALNERREYKVEIRDEISETLHIKNVRGVEARNQSQVAEEISEADCLGTAVGKNALDKIVPNLSKGLEQRYSKYGKKVIDIIICENILNGAEFLRRRLKKNLPANIPFENMVGLVETSIGKMVPIMSQELKEKDLLLVYAEAYNYLIVDKKGFKGEIPKVPGLVPKENIQAYVKRKSFVHNLGHAMIAYLEYVENKGYTYTWEAVRDPKLRDKAKQAMWESGQAMIKAYPQEFSRCNQEEYIERLLKRFGNVYLGDTIFRVGRDVQRKLSYNDRLIGAMRFDLFHGVEPKMTAAGAAAACFFKKRDLDGTLYPRDEEFHRDIFPKGIDYILRHVCSLRKKNNVEKEIIVLIKQYFEKFKGNMKKGGFNF